MRLNELRWYWVLLMTNSKQTIRGFGYKRKAKIIIHLLWWLN